MTLTLPFLAELGNYVGFLEKQGWLDQMTRKHLDALFLKLSTDKPQTLKSLSGPKPNSDFEAPPQT